MLDEVRTPRLVIAGTASNVGKTILTAGLIAAFKSRGLTVQSFKVGPDYIDAAYLAHVSGRPCRNLDSWMLGEGALRQVLAQGVLGVDLALVEACSDSSTVAEGAPMAVRRMSLASSRRRSSWSSTSTT